MILPILVVCLSFVAVASVAHADAMSDLEQSIRAVLMRDSHATNIPTEQLEALVYTLAREAASRGIEPRRIDAGTMGDVLSHTSEVSGFNTSENALFSAPMLSRWLAVFGALILLIALIVLSRLVHRRVGH